METTEFDFSKGIHWCVNQLIQKLEIIYPHELIEANGDQKDLMREMTTRPISLMYRAFPQSVELVYFKKTDEYNFIVDLLFTEQYKRIQMLKLEAVAASLN